ncbi:hypothetical protein P3S68_024553 [Capsicum galapagoense]
MTSLRVNPSVPLRTLDKIGTIQRRSTTACMLQRKPIGVSSTSLSLSNRVAKNDDQRKEKAILSRNIEEWMNVSMVDIVKNLKQAPLFVHVYANEDDERGGQVRRRPRIKTERAMLEKWPMMKSEWESGKTTTPDGLIFVQELRDDEEENRNVNLVEDSDEVLKKSWGVIVQEKGIEFGPTCYLLKTSRVRAGRGMDLFCTHFCLVRVKNFRDSALKQFKSCWL